MANRYGGQKLEELEIVEADDYIQVCPGERCEAGPPYGIICSSSLLPTIDRCSFGCCIYIHSVSYRMLGGIPPRLYQPVALL